ncbi:MAG: NAD(P)-dependent glycerol-3-phosphate dehydrogenase [Burkholderiales bacterium]|nr:NAD(P)-dependent glycerol-3-phosphate dehydrogenase [Burkholderiales bacterium]
MDIGVLGAGAWGTSLAATLARTGNRRVRLWAREAGLARTMRETRENPQFLPGVALPAQVEPVDDVADALAGDLIVVASAVAGLRPTLTTIAAGGGAVPVVWLCKGFEQGTSLLPHQVAAAVLPAQLPRGVLSGPSFAAEVARGLPVALTLAAADGAFAGAAAQMLHGGSLRIYSSRDVTGVEIGGAVKNVIALAAGISDGLGLGLNARAALITRGLAEMARLGAALGARAETFMGLTGMGDLILTATGDLSRNRTVGRRLADGADLDRILGELGHVAEGVYTARETRELARRHAVDMPITEAVCGILFEGLEPRQAVSGLLARDARFE